MSDIDRTLNTLAPCLRGALIHHDGVEIKTRCDPDNLFRRNQNIPARH
jgi:hypothetical protein